MGSNQNSLLFSMCERPACIDSAGLIMKKPFISHNGIIKLGWIEHQHCITMIKKNEMGVLTKVNGRVVATCFVEFAGGMQYNFTAMKEKNGTTKLSKNMKTIATICMKTSLKEFAVSDSSVSETMLCVHQ